MPRRPFVVSALLLATLACPLLRPPAWGWGTTGHQYVNRNAVYDLPRSMTLFIAQASWLEAHASDADARKSIDPSEDAKHYIDLENYPDFSHLPLDIASATSLYGTYALQNNGWNPWAAAVTFDSLTAQLTRRDFTRAWQSAADLGHYIADGHQPLHCTVNYDGRQTGNTGIHSRYETGMLGQYKSVLPVCTDSAVYIAEPAGVIISHVLYANSLVDSILHADTYARRLSGWNGLGQAPSTYYAYLWARTDTLTTRELQSAALLLASLWYTAWVNAGLDVVAGLGPEEEGAEGQRHRALPAAFRLDQNYPNPCNPTTTIAYNLSAASDVTLDVYSMLGEKVASLVRERQAAGAHAVRFDGRSCASGVYFYRLSVAGASLTRRLILLR